MLHGRAALRPPPRRPAGGPANRRHRGAHRVRDRSHDRIRARAGSRRGDPPCGWRPGPPGYGGPPAQPPIVECCAALAAAGIAALRFPYRDHQPPRMTLDTGTEDATAALAALRAAVGEASAVVGFSFGGCVAARLAG